MKKVCVFGTYKNLNQKDEEIVRLGRLLAANGITVVSGGFGGSMENVSKGAKLGGGKTIGVTYYKQDDPPGKGANQYVDEEIKTKDIFERISVMMDVSDGFIALQGGTGTLLELASVLEHINKGMMSPKPIVAIGRYWKGVIDSLGGEEVLSQKARHRLSARTCSDLVVFAENVDEAVKRITERIGKGA